MLKAALLLAACSGPVEPPSFSLTCEYAPDRLVTVPDEPPGKGSCFEIRATSPDWRITDGACPSRADTCARGLPGDTFAVYRTQRKLTHEGGFSAGWVNCETACKEE